MAFVNEYISREDVEKYQLREIDEHFKGTRARDWTFDRSRNIYLRNVANGREELMNETTWTFYWKVHTLTLRLDLLGGRGEAGAPGWSHWKLVGISGLTEELKAVRDQVFQDLREALTAYKGAGVFSSNTEYSIKLDISKECLE